LKIFLNEEIKAFVVPNPRFFAFFIGSCVRCLEKNSKIFEGFPRANHEPRDPKEYASTETAAPFPGMHCMRFTA